MHPSCMKVFFQSNNLITLVKRETTVLELLIYVSIKRMHRTILLHELTNYSWNGSIIIQVCQKQAIHKS